MMKAQIVTEWTGTGLSGNPRRPLIADFYSMDWIDISEQPAEKIIPVINAMTVEVIIDDLVLDAIELDTRFVVLMSEVYIA